MKNTPTLMKYLAGLAVACGSGISASAQSGENSETILFDTLSGFVLGFDTPTTAAPGEGKTVTTHFGAQKIMTGENGIVSSVSVYLGHRTDGFFAIPQGVIHVEIWDDDEGRPGLKVGSLGDIDLPGVALLSDGGEAVTVENPVVGLKPNSIHHVVFNFIDSKSFILRQAPGEREDPEVLVPLVWWPLAKDPGTIPGVTFGKFDTVEMPPIPDGVYSLPSDVIYYWSDKTRPLIMKVTESTDDLPTPEISSFQRSNDSASLTWKSLPFKTYTLESSASLDSDQWNEIEDGIESTGFETVFVDDDAERLAAKEVYYRVRMEELGD